MSPNVDVQEALDLVPQLAATLAEHEHALRVAAPDLDNATVRDRALRAALARLRVELSAETFMYLQCKVEVAARTLQAAREVAEATRGVQPDARDAFQPTVPRPAEAPTASDDALLALRPPEHAGARIPPLLGTVMSEMPDLRDAEKAYQQGALVYALPSPEVRFAAGSLVAYRTRRLTQRWVNPKLFDALASEALGI